VRVLLVEPDYYTRYPPLGLLKLASWHRARGDEVRLVRGQEPSREWTPNRIYVTSLFTYAWRPVHAAVRHYRSIYPSTKVVLGGIYASLLPRHAATSGAEVHVGLHPAAEAMTPAWDLIPEWDGSILFASRGCIRKCGFCSVPKLEGPPADFREDIASQVWPAHSRVILWDNNVLGNWNWREVLEELVKIRKEVDFNQGLDARLITDEVASLLKRIPTRSIRLAYDYPGIREQVKRGIERLAAAGISKKKIVVYTLYNYIETPNQFLGKVRDLLDWGVTSYPMRFEPLTSLTKNAYVSPRWTREELDQVAKARRVLGYAGAFPPYSGLVRKLDRARSFRTAFRLRKPRQRRHEDSSGHLVKAAPRFGGVRDWRKTSPSSSASVEA
jgi:hypothetical protein